LQLPAWAVSSNRINGVRLTQQGSGVVVEIAGERAPNFTTFKQDKPRRVIVDVAECDLNGVPPRISGDGSLVERITTRQYGESPHSISRVVIQLRSEAEYKVTIRGGSLFVHLSPGAGGLLVSAGVPVGPQRGTARKPDVAAMTGAAAPIAKADTPTPRTDPRDQALAEELSRPELEVTAPAESPATPAEEAEEPPAGPAVVAEPLPPPSTARLPEPAPEVVAEPEPSSPLAAGDEPEPAPMRVAMVMPEEKPAEPAPAPRPPVVAQDEEEEVEEADEVPVEVVEEVEEVPEIPDEVPAEEAVPPPEDTATDAAAEEAVESEYEAVPEPPDEVAPEEVEVPEPPAETEVPMPPPPDEIPPPPPDSSYSEVEERVEISGAHKHMTWVGFQQTKQSSRVFVKTNVPVEYRVSEEGQNIIVLELENTSIPKRNNRRFLDTRFFDSAVSMIVPREVGGVSRSVRIEIQLKNRVPYRAGREDNMVFVSFERPQ
jgi:hypothetical protein